MEKISALNRDIWRCQYREAGAARGGPPPSEKGGPGPRGPGRAPEVGEKKRKRKKRKKKRKRKKKEKK